MKLATAIDIPGDRKPEYQKAKLLQWTTIFYLLSVVVLLYFVMGSSQAMRAAWLEDILSLVPSIIWTIATPIAWRNPDPKFPYGYHRSVSIGYLAASLPLLVLGVYLVSDAAMTLIKAEHPTMGTLVIYGQPVWVGWPALLALVYSSVPSVILGRMKLKLADRLHDKVLFADAKMRKADWLTAGAAMIGIIGVGFGLWWLDAAAALVIGLDVTRDGLTQTKHAIGDLADRRPMTTPREEDDDLPERIRDRLCRLGWVKDAKVRLREAGHILYGEGFVVPTGERVAVRSINEAADGVVQMDWRLAEFVLTPVPFLDDADANEKSAGKDR